MIELCEDSIALPLSIILNNIINTGIFPAIWKSANVTPVHKKESKQIVKNYRPNPFPFLQNTLKGFCFQICITTLSQITLSLKIILASDLVGDSVTNQLTFLVDKIHSSLDINLEVRSVFLDMSKVFGKVRHVGLLFKLRQNGINGKLINILKIYLSNRKQRVLINCS